MYVWTSCKALDLDLSQLADSQHVLLARTHGDQLPFLDLSLTADSQYGLLDQLQALVFGLSQLTRSQHVIVDQLLGPGHWSHS